MKDILKKILKAKQNVDIVKIIDQDLPQDKIKWRYVGDRENNYSTIGIGTDPASGLVERITNAIDSVIEKAWVLNNEEDLNSPREAVSKWFGIEKGKLRTIKDPNDKRLKELSNRVKVTIQDSDNEKTPTVEIRDHGIGLRSEEFCKTILSLHGSNKWSKGYVMGAFGQGGSTAMAFNNFTIIVSRKFDKKKSQKEISFTIVKINPGDPEKDKQSWYEYIVDKRTNNPFSYVEEDSDLFEPGTLVRHINMDLGKFKGKITTPSNSLWYLAHNYLFDPIIPFQISDSRQDRKDNRSVTGNNRLLTHTDNLEYGNEIEHTFKNGKVQIYWWVLNTSGDKPRDRIRNYTTVQEPIVITHNGQKQGGINNSLIKNDLKLPYIDRYLIVQIETEGLDKASKRQLFSTTREQIRQTQVYFQLKELAISTLSGDDKLKDINKSRKESLFSSTSSEVSDKVRQRLARRVNTFLTGGGDQSGGRISGGGGGGSRTRENIPESDPPTFLNIKSDDPKEIYPNKISHLKFETDATSSLFHRPETFMVYVNPQDTCIYTGKTNVIGGYGTAYFKTSENAEIGSEGEITFELRPPNHKTIISSVKFKVAEFTDNSGGGTGNRQRPNINPHLLFKNDHYYTELGWNENSVCIVNEGEDEIQIFVNGENKNLLKIVERANRRGTEAVINIQNKYLEHMAFYAFVQNKNFKDNLQLVDDSTIDLDKIKTYEQVNASETVCGMINDMFESFIIEQKED